MEVLREKVEVWILGDYVERQLNNEECIDAVEELEWRSEKK